MDVDTWDAANAELREIIGDVTLSITEIEDSLGELILDLLVLPPVHQFYRQHVLRHQSIDRKIRLLTAYVRAMPECTTSPDTALDTLAQMAEANRERNRLVHDLHEVDLEHGQVARRRLWEEKPTIVDLDAYRGLALHLGILAAPGVEALYDALMLPLPSRPPTAD